MDHVNIAIKTVDAFFEWKKMIILSIFILISTALIELLNWSVPFAIGISLFICSMILLRMEIVKKRNAERALTRSLKELNDAYERNEKRLQKIFR